MNEFLTSYLGGIIPVAFRIQSGEESMIVGRDGLSLRSRLTKIWTRKNC